MQSKPSSPKLNESHSLTDALRVDRFRLSRIRKRISQESFEQQVSESVEKKRLRESIQPRLEYSEELPITQYRQELIQKIHDHQVIIVCGETGSGKSTQLPKFCLEAGLGRDGVIGHTQPRRLAARSIASRLAEEVGGKVGEVIGYKVRFGDQTGGKTLIKLMTDGILLAETQRDRYLNQYDALIIDEAHERSLNIDFILGYLKNLQRKRPDLKIIITSATIDAERFSEHFSTGEEIVPIVNVEGRGFPVEIQYLPWNEKDEVDRQYHLPSHVVSGLNSITGEGDTLVFLPTERDIREVSHYVAGHYKRMGLEGRYDLLPLYARLPQSQQQKIFRPEGNKNRVIFATNVAESSLTVPGIRFVIDAGTARISRYNPRLKVQRLPVEAVSQASANQRAGRCGRLGPGTCIRLYSEEDYDSRPPFTTPEIQRSNLASVILQLKSLRLGTVDDFPLLDRPKPAAITDGMRTLRELNAIDGNQSLTSLGRKLARLPVDPRVARILVEAVEHHCLPEILPIAAALEIQDPRERPVDQRQAADESHLQFSDPQSDFLSLLKLWKYYREIKANKSRNQVDKTLRRQFISPNRMREWSDVYRQLKDLMADKQGRAHFSHNAQLSAIRYVEDSESVVSKEIYEKIHQSLLSGLLSGVAMAGNKREYTGAGGIKLFLWPGSGIAESKPKWIVASELIETSKTFARVVAKIQPAWIESVASHLLNRSYSEPHWSRKKSSALCYEAQHLFGLPIVLRRRVPLAPIDPSTARELLIEEGLADEGMRTNARFYQHNQSLLNALKELASRTRNRDLIVDRYQLSRLYHDHLPEEIKDRHTLEKYDKLLSPPKWFSNGWSTESILQVPPRETKSDDPLSIFFHPDEFLNEDLSVDEKDFPNEIEIEGSKLPLQYTFAPGSEDDGIRLSVHQSTVSQLSQGQLEWMVPGVFVDKIIQLIKSLPKRLRRNFVPAAESARIIAEQLKGQYRQESFFPALCKALSRYAETEITEFDFQAEKLDDYLKFMITVVDDDGKKIAEDRDLSSLQKSFQDSNTTIRVNDFSAEDESWSRSKVTSFDVDIFPQHITKNQSGMSIRFYPGWVDHGSSVSTELYTSLKSAEKSIREATARLFYLAEQKEIRAQIRYLPGIDQAKIKLADVVSSKTLDSRLMNLLARIAFVDNEELIRSRRQFESRKVNAVQRLSMASQDIARWLNLWVSQHFELRTVLESKKKWLDDKGQLHSIENQLAWLYHGEFLETTPWKWLTHYPRYLQAIVIKIDRLSQLSRKMADSETVINDLWQRWQSTLTETDCDAISQSDSEFRWMIEELRVSLFAQSLGTSVKVSPQRCERLLEQ